MTEAVQDSLPGNLVLQVSPERLRLSVNCTVNPGEEELVFSALQDELTRMGVTDLTSSEEAIHRLREALGVQRISIPTAAPAVIKELVLLEGSPPEEPIDSHIEWAGNFFSEGFAVDPETGLIDYRQRASQLSVEEGQLLGTMHPSEEGKPGRDIFGKSMTPRKPRQLLVRIGPNVRHDDDNNQFYALTVGRLRYAKNMLAVDQIVVLDNVNLATGNIKHPGALIITQNIETGSTVEAAGDIEVRGYIESSVIRCGGSLLVRGGITGGSTLQVSGDIHAKFIQNTKAEVLNNVVAEREIDQCEIKARGAVTVTSGRIVGGEITGHGGVFADYLGSGSGSLTTITAGVDFWYEERRHELEGEMISLTERSAQICEKLNPFRKNGVKVPEQAKEAVRILTEQVQAMVTRIKALEEELEALRSESVNRRKLEIIARRLVHSDVKLHMCGMILKPKEEVPGPVRVGLRDGDLCFMETRLKR